MAVSSVHLKSPKCNALKKQKYQSLFYERESIRDLIEATAESCWQQLAKVPRYLVLTTVLFRPKVHTHDLFILPTITQNCHKSEKNYSASQK